MQDVQIQIEPNPFALMLHPQEVLQAIEASAPLSSLRRRVYRPLDRPMLGATGNGKPVAIDDEDDDGEEVVGTDFGMDA